jgi:hypothetical protein
MDNPGHYDEYPELTRADEERERNRKAKEPDMNTDTDTVKLKPCPFCGSSAKSDNGFSPCESVTYAWCSNQDCSLCTIEFGFTVDEWQARKSTPSKAGSVPCYQCKGCGDNDCAPGRCVRCDGTGIEPNPDMNTTTTKIAGEAMTDQNIERLEALAKHFEAGGSTLIGEGMSARYAEAIRALLARKVPSNVMAALDRMCTPLDESVLKGATAEADAHSMKLIRDYVLSTAPAQSRGDAEQADEAVTLPEMFKSPLTSFGLLVRALRIVADTTLYDMAKALSSTPATLSAVECGRKPLTEEMVIDTYVFFTKLGVLDTLHALNAARAKDSK